MITITTTVSPASLADTIYEAISNRKAYGDFRLRYESVQQDNTKKDPNSLTLCTRLGYTSDQIDEVSATLEFEDSRSVAGIGN